MCNGSILRGLNALSPRAWRAINNPGRANVFSTINAPFLVLHDTTESLVINEDAAAVEEVGVRTFADCRLLAYFRNGGRTVRAGVVTQVGELLFEQTVV